MVENGIILSHIGQLGYNTIGELLRQLDSKMKELKIDELIKKKIYALIVECLENIDRHKHPELKNINPIDKFNTEFFLEFDNNAFLIRTGNPIHNSDVEKLKDKLEMVNSLDEKGLKKIYRKTLLSGQISEKGGAGVGIIDMAKISQNKIEYSFKPIDKELSYYSLKLKINNSTK